MMKHRRGRHSGGNMSRRTMIKGLAGLAMAISGVSCAPAGSSPAPASSTPHITPGIAPTSAAPSPALYTYRGHAGAVNAVSWSPNGRRIASASADGTVQLWDDVMGGNVYTYKGHASAVSGVAWSPGGKLLASAGDDRTVQVWQAR